MTQQVANFKEEFSSKIPALTLLSTLGYQFIMPNLFRLTNMKKIMVVLMLYCSSC